MALTRKLLKSFGLEESVIDSIIEAHGETIDVLKKQRDDAQAEASKVSEITKERDDLKKEVETLKSKGGDAAKVQADFDAYKAQVEEEKTLTTKRNALEALLRDKVGIHRESARRLILDAAKYDEYELDDKGNLSGADKLAKDLGTKYAEFIGKKGENGTDKTDPPSGNGGKLTRDEIYRKDDKGRYVLSTAERQKALAESMAADSDE